MWIRDVRQGTQVRFPEAKGHQAGEGTVAGTTEANDMDTQNNTEITEVNAGFIVLKDDGSMEATVFWFGYDQKWERAKAYSPEALRDLAKWCVASHEDTRNVGSRFGTKRQQGERIVGRFLRPADKTFKGERRRWNVIAQVAKAQ